MAARRGKTRPESKKRTTQITGTNVRVSARRTTTLAGAARGARTDRVGSVHASEIRGVSASAASGHRPGVRIAGDTRRTVQAVSARQY